MKFRALFAALLTVGLVVGPSAVATAAPEPFIPSDSKTRAYMLNILGSVLKGATPDKWRRELLANQNRYNFGLESLDVAYNGGKQMNGDFIKNPSSYDDYVIKAYESELAKKPARPPATRAAKLEKFVGGVGGAVAAVTAAQFGFSVGKGISQIIGHDVESGICSPTFEDGGLISTITGTDCEAWLLDNDFVPNGDVEGGIGLNYCWQNNASLCVTYIGSYTYSGTNYWCATSNASSTASVGIAWRTPGTSNWSQSSMAHATTSTNASVGCVNLGGQRRFGTPSTSGTATTPIYPDAYEFCAYFSAVNVCGTPVTPTEIPADPERTLQCSITADNGQTYTATSEPYKESDGAVAPPVCPDLPPGVNPVNYTVTEQSPNGTAELYNEDTTPEFQQWLNDFPQCAYGACSTDLLDLRSGTPVSCFDTGNECADWFADPAKVDNYQCTHGGEPVPLSECYVYAVLFKPGQVEIGAPYADPETGEWSGGQSSPGASQALFGGEVRDPTAARSCYGQGWAEFNPVEWIMQPIQCALEWAFVPRPAVVALEVAKAKDSWDETPPGVMIGTVGAWQVDLSLDGCNGVPLTWRGDTVQMLDACPGSTLAPLASTSHTISGAVFVIGGIFALISIVAGVIGYRGLTVAGGNH